MQKSFQRKNSLVEITRCHYVEPIFPATLKGEAGELQIQGQPQQLMETLFQDKKFKRLLCCSVVKYSWVQSPVPALKREEGISLIILFNSHTID